MPQLPVRATFATFFSVRGTHLAAMVAYFALASIVPLVFLALAILGLFGRVDESSALVTYLSDLLPSQSVDDIVGSVRAVQDNARKLGIVGGIFLLWSSLSLFSSLESAFNVVYGRPNRPFLRGKALALGYMVVSLVVLFAGLVIGTFGFDIVRRYAPDDVVSNQVFGFALTIALSTMALFLFLLSAYYRLTNARLTRREVLPGAILGAVAMEVALQALPTFVTFSGDILALRALGATFLLLIWLYVLANVIVFGAALNWQLAYGRTGRGVVAKRADDQPASA
jgi:membrane protein